MKRSICLWAMLTLLAACSATTDEPIKGESATMPGAAGENGKGDWRTTYYTDFRGQVYVNDTVADTYEPYGSNYYYGYEVTLEAGDVVDVRVGEADGSFDPVIGLYGPQRPSGDWGSLVAANDDTPEGGSYDSYIQFEAPESGNYLVLVRDYNWQRGELWLSVSCAGGTCEQTECAEVMCALYCDEYERDENGCQLCACADTSTACPAPSAPQDTVCAQVVTWAKNPATGDCCQYPTPCHAPEGWETHSSEEACLGPAQEGEVCAMYGRQCAEGLECDYRCPDGSDDPNCNLGFNPNGYCVAAAACQEGESRPADDGCNTCTCSNGQWACTEMACQPAECTTDADCVVTGCSGQICASEPMITTCEWRPEYACYDDSITSCGCNNGQCGWAQTQALEQCLGN